MQNVEAKFRCVDLAAVEHRAREIGARDAGMIEQTDTFFNVPRGRMKLRQFGDGSGELISYLRPDDDGARVSSYQIYRTNDVAGLARTLDHMLGTRGVVKKRRRLFLVENTRIHLDTVEGLGTFVELETVVSDQSLDDAREEMNRIARSLGLREVDSVASAYIDLIERA